MPDHTHTYDPQQLSEQIKVWGKALGFQQLGITDTELAPYTKRLKAWLAKNYHGEMSYMARNIEKRCDPKKLLPGTKSVIAVRIDYLPPQPNFRFLKNPIKAFISRYALGRDYHKLIRKRLQKLADKIQTEVGEFNYRCFTDSAPVFEKPLAEKAGLGWIGKHTNLINKDAGSWFFLGILYTDLTLALDKPVEAHCGTCTACLDVCPTQAIVAPHQLDARRCISYLTIELRTAIPETLRPLIGNRIYGCDDCQIICPWNKFASTTEEEGFYARRGLSQLELVDVLAWNEKTFLDKTEGSAIRRLGFECWSRNVAVALGNMPYSKDIVAALENRLNDPSELVQEHVQWAMKRQKKHQKQGFQPVSHQKLSLIREKHWLYLDK